MTKAVAKKKSVLPVVGNYSGLVGSISELLDAARRASVRTVNAFMTATYWEIGRRIVEFEQGGEKRAGYGEELLSRLAHDLTARFGRGFSVQNLENMRLFYRVCGEKEIFQTLSGKSALALSAPSTVQKSQTLSGISAAQIFDLADMARAFPLPWSHYVLLIRRSRSPEAFGFYHTAALRGGWSVRQLQRQMDSQFYERTALSRHKAAMLTKGAKNLLLHGIGEAESASSVAAGSRRSSEEDQWRDAAAKLGEQSWTGSVTFSNSSDLPVVAMGALAGKHGEYEIVLANQPFTLDFFGWLAPCPPRRRLQWTTARQDPDPIHHPAVDLRGGGKEARNNKLSNLHCIRLKVRAWLCHAGPSYDPTDSGKVPIARRYDG